MKAGQERRDEVAKNAKMAAGSKRGGKKDEDRE